MKKYFYLNILLALIIVLELNYLATEHNFRFDFTPDKRYTLSEASVDLVSSLDQPLNITVYISSDVMPEFAIFAREVKSVLEDYRLASGGKIFFSVTDPLKSDRALAKANADGVKPFIVDVYDKDQVKSTKAYSSVVFKYNGRTEKIDYLEPSQSLEYMFSSAIEKLIYPGKPVIGILQGDNLPPFSKYKAFINSLDAYKVEPFYYDSLPLSSDKYSVIALIAPKKKLPAKTFEFLDKYLASGGRVFVALNTVEGKIDANPPVGNALNTGVDKWLENFGLKVNTNFIIDAVCGQIPVIQSNPAYRTKVDFPYFPVITNFAKHPVTTGLNAVVMSFASSIDIKQTKNIKATSIAFSGEHSGIVKPPVVFNFFRQWKKSDFPLSHLPVGVALEGDDWKMVVFSDGDFLQLPAGEQYENSDNIYLAVNSIDWLADKSGLIEVRTKGAEYKPIKDLGRKEKVFVKYLNLLLPIIFVLLIGLFVVVKNRKKRSL